jgi:hypothetical protein
MRPIDDDPYDPGPGDPSDPPGTTPIGTLTRYNLQNQSWGLPRKNKLGVLTDPIDIYNIEYPNLAPNNSEVVWTGLQYQPVVGGADPYERIFPSLYREKLGAGPPAPKGFYIIDLLDRGASRVAAFERNYNNSFGALSVPTFTTVEDRTTGGASIVAEFAGRIFYSGFTGEVVGGDELSPNLSNYVVFSQLVKNAADLTKCYQEGDPTSREESDVVDTDGGYIRITGAKKIIALQSMRTSLLVFADNGVWAISGNGDNGFTATNYAVSKLSEYGCTSPNSVIVDGERIMYWGEDGIYLIVRDKFAQFIVESLTQKTIQTMYDSIPIASKQGCKGVYDSKFKRISWLYKEGVAFTSTSVTKELVMDTTINAFSINRIVNLADYSHEVADIYFDDGVKFVIVKKTTPNTSFGFAAYNNDQFIDWKSANGVGVDAKAFFLTGFQIAGDSAIHKQTPYLVLHFRKTESVTDSEGTPLNQSGCLYRTQWDWANGVQSNRFSALMQGYKYRTAYYANLPDTTYDNGYLTVTTKNKVRGRGRSFALYCESEPTKECDFLGWNLTINGNGLA